VTFSLRYNTAGPIHATPNPPNKICPFSAAAETSRLEKLLIAVAIIAALGRHGFPV
jgi:hypothetical protein